MNPGYRPVIGWHAPMFRLKVIQHPAWQIFIKRTPGTTNVATEAQDPAGVLDERRIDYRRVNMLRLGGEIHSLVANRRRVKETGGFLSVAVKDLAPEIRTSCSGWCYPCPEFASSPSSTGSSLPHTHYMLPVGVSEPPNKDCGFPALPYGKWFLYRTCRPILLEYDGFIKQPTWAKNWIVSAWEKGETRSSISRCSATAASWELGKEQILELLGLMILAWWVYSD